MSNGYNYISTEPYCLLHGSGHWTKNCDELTPQNNQMER
jgi:hypothetical protein